MNTFGEQTVTGELLIVDDNLMDREICLGVLKSSSISFSRIVQAVSLQEARQYLRQTTPVIILLDYHLNDGEGSDLLPDITQSAQSHYMLTPLIIMITGQGGESIVASAFREGITDYIIKKDLMANLIPALERAVHKLEVQTALNERISKDSLTKLLNRATFLERATAYIKEAQLFEEQCAVIYLDLDNFKKINDTYGHKSGDLFLIEISHRINKLCRKSDLAARFGGDEFVILMKGISKRVLIQKIDQWVQDNNKITSQVIPSMNLSCSVGITLIDLVQSKPVSINQLLEQADAAMYKVKQNHKGGYGFFNSNETIMVNFLEHDIDKAITLDQFELNFQPIRSAQNLSIVGFEILACWPQAPDELTTTQLFHYIEKYNLEQMYQHWLLQKVFHYLSNWKDELDSKIYFSINAPNSTKGCLHFKQELTQSIKHYAPEIQFLRVEISESSFNQYYEFFLQFKADLELLGIKVSLDQFGRQPSNLVDLASIHFETLKCRKEDCVTSTGHTTFEKMIRLGSHVTRSIHSELIAVGIETEAEMQAALKAGAVHLQGYMLGRPQIGHNSWFEFMQCFETSSKVNAR